MPYEQTPCARCELKENSDFTIEYDEGREKPGSLGRPTTDGRPEAEERCLPISVMQELVTALLCMPRDVRDAVCWRYAGFKYREVAKVQNVTMAAVEVRHRRALRRWPVLQALFPEKVAKQGRRGRDRRRMTDDG